MIQLELVEENVFELARSLQFATIKAINHHSSFTIHHTRRLSGPARVMIQLTRRHRSTRGLANYQAKR